MLPSPRPNSHLFSCDPIAASLNVRRPLRQPLSYLNDPTNRSSKLMDYWAVIGLTLTHTALAAQSQRDAGHFPQRVIQTLWFNREPGVLVDVSSIRDPDSHPA